MRITRKQLRQLIENTLIEADQYEYYEVIASWDGFEEELEVQARNGHEAERKAKEELELNYEPGWKIVSILPSRPQWRPGAAAPDENEEYLASLDDDSSAAPWRGRYREGTVRSLKRLIEARRAISYQQLDTEFPGALEALMDAPEAAPILGDPSEMEFWVEDGELMTVAETEYEGPQELIWIMETGEWMPADDDFESESEKETSHGNQAPTTWWVPPSVAKN